MEVGFLLGVRLTYAEHINVEIKTTNKNIIVIIKLHLSLPWASQLTIYKSFAWPHLVYENVICDQNSNLNRSDKIETIQHNALLPITDGNMGTSREKYQELGLES